MAVPGTTLFGGDFSHGSGKPGLSGFFKIYLPTRGNHIGVHFDYEFRDLQVKSSPVRESGVCVGGGGAHAC